MQGEGLHYRALQLVLTLQTLPPLQVSERYFVAMYGAEFYMKLYVDAIDFWKNGYNLLDMTVIFILMIPYSLRKVKGKHYPYLNIVDGLQSLRILKLITYSRGIRVSDLGVQETELMCPSTPKEIIIESYCVAG